MPTTRRWPSDRGPFGSAPDERRQLDRGRRSQWRARMAGEVQDLVTGREVFDRAGGALGANRIEVDQDVIHHDRQRLGLPGEVIDEAEAKGEVELLGGPG